MRRAAVDPVVRDPAATVVQAVEVAAWAAVVLPAAKVVVEVAPAVAVAADKVVEDRAAVAVDARRTVVVVDRVVAVAEWEEAVVVAVHLEVEAAAAVNSSPASGASRVRRPVFL